MNKKKIIIGVCAFLILLVGIIITSVIVLNNNRTNEEELKKEITKLGKDVYENNYYQVIGSDDESRASNLSLYKDTGIKFNLDNLATMSSLEEDKVLDKFVNSKTGEKCDAKKSRVIIYPKESYKQKDYTIEVELECGF